MFRNYCTIPSSILLQRFCLAFLLCYNNCMAQQPSGRIASALNSLCLEIEGRSEFENAVVVQDTCNAAENQKYSLESAAPVKNYYRIRAMHDGMCLTATPENVTQTVCRDADTQLWRIEASPSNAKLSTIASKYNKLCLAAAPGAAGAPIVQAACSASNVNQRWSIGTALNATKIDLPGLWEGPYNMGIIPVAAANLIDGRILTWSAYSPMAGGGSYGYTWTTIFDPTTTSSTLEKVVDTNHDMFCPGTSLLPDGRIMIAGGSTAEATTFYYPDTDTWVRGPNMTNPRGYQTQTVLPDGTVFTFGGSWSGTRGNKDGEVYSDSPSPGAWTPKRNIASVGDFLTNDERGIYRSDNHMWLFTAPNGKVFHAGPAKRTHWIDCTGEGNVTPSVFRSDADAMNGNAVMYDNGKLLTVGGAPNYGTGTDPATNRAFTIDINDENNVVVTEVGPMHFNRTLANSVVLPNGHVVIIGGRATPKIFSDLYSVYSAEIWNPDTGLFKLLPPMYVPRNYHSVAILLQDGRIFTGGGGLCGDCGSNHLNGEILTPPYLLHANGTLQTNRPLIVSVSAPRPTPGQTITIQMASADLYTCALVRMSAVTHTVNTDMRRIPLSVPSGVVSQFSVTLPSNPAISLPGTYFLFVMNSDGVPSVAKTITIPVVTKTPTQPTTIPSTRPTRAPTASPVLGDTRLRYNLSSLCAEVNAGRTGDGVRLVQNNCTNTLSQTFKMEAIPNSPDTYRFIAKHSNKCITISGNSTSKGAAVVQSTCIDGAPYQQFLLTAGANGNQRQLRSKHAENMCVKVKQLSLLTGAVLAQLPCKNSTEDYWKVSLL